ncbi:uncharacterized protein LOC129942684 [Eupeodes corollae]|uniref:uncharacterized protein LOC129942684 n=1 Tax=Eupeodes corollae TaxID=290404 RepID=UPI00249315EB|nr:uncharacterized protein LOC129942684 [Eupeodes corollae]
MNIKHKFNSTKKKAGYAWLASFLERNKDISLRQSEGLSLSRAQGMNRSSANDFFEVLHKVLTENNLMDKPGNIFYMDESGLQLNNKPGKVLTQKGVKDIHVVTAKEKGENVTVVACCNAEGNFLPPVLIMKGVNRKAEFMDGLPSGSDVYMNKKSSYINTELLFRWLKEHFMPRKPVGKTLLILDGHTSHSNALEMLEFAENNKIIILCLPSHTTQALQPLDRSFFKPLKSFFHNEAKAWMNHHKNRTITRYQAGHLIGNAWEKAASVGNGASGFRATGIYPFNPQAIPDHFFSISDSAAVEVQQSAALPSETIVLSPESNLEPVIPTTSNASHNCNHSENETHTSTCFNKPTPTKLLQEISPLPKIPALTFSRRRQKAEVLTSPNSIEKKKKIKSPKPQEEKKASKRKIEPAANPNVCAECWENYFLTKKREDWIQCSKCSKWLHENCTRYKKPEFSLCTDCGRDEERKKHAGDKTK